MVQSLGPKQKKMVGAESIPTPEAELLWTVLLCSLSRSPETVVRQTHAQSKQS